MLRGSETPRFHTGIGAATLCRIQGPEILVGTPGVDIATAFRVYPHMQRRIVLAILASLLLVGGPGCSEGSKKARRTTSTSKKSSGTRLTGPSRLPTLGGSPSTAGGKRPKGPQTMGGFMLDAWKDDLSNASSDKRIRAANELANMGSSARSALPTLEKMTSDRNPQVAAAARAAVAAIKR